MKGHWEQTIPVCQYGNWKLTIDFTSEEEKNEAEKALKRDFVKYFGWYEEANPPVQSETTNKTGFKTRKEGEEWTSKKGTKCKIIGGDAHWYDSKNGKWMLIKTQ